ncbi:helix-turn-helix domain-containing protein [Ferrovum sp. PN-J185]|uniref:ArsR/SmtB family transcription factor n=1 Tax=Ferrovum sp. PN-J185 TaxID=1356306 RepID=UPI0007942524|nr:metalloregulator ArsR/SmtB family transcription factor [Ferrovum sp. PN-J185]KXW56741.1 helix-turn-helix domain protein [Ferrovum sp. PN-J185]MCC6067574.1 helix-turn-helix domain-containing protein [Ferrovum sp. PN-J185]MDE1892066.1 helix-turn-helix transcriptional regulator [Betaproteobacteria bacterium]MDE2056485.1 helix-turn-helix transcriptional regulator [Betaproteobacteria bacterium]
MEIKNAVLTLTSLAQESRLEIFRLLVKAGKTGLSAGKISELTQIPPSTLSFHMKELLIGGIVHSRQEGRFVIYSAHFVVMNELMTFLTENCCSGEECLPDFIQRC